MRLLLSSGLMLATAGALRADPAPLPHPPLDAVAQSGSPAARPDASRPDSPERSTRSAADGKPELKPEAKPESKPETKSESKPDAKPSDPPAAPADSPAERIARLRRSLDSDSQRMAELRASVLGGGSEYSRCEDEFKSIDGRRQALRDALAKARSDQDADLERKLELEFAEADAAWQSAKRRFEKAIAERQTTNEAIQNLEQKIKLDRDSLDKLLGAVPAPPAKEPVLSVERSAAAPTTESGSTGLPAVPNTAPKDLLGALPSSLPSTLPAAPAAPAGSPAAPVAKPAASPSRALHEAHVAAQQTAVAAQQAEQEVRTLTERLDLLRRGIASERSLRDAAQQRVDESDAEIRGLSEEMQHAIAEGRDPTDIGRRLQQAEQRHRDARAEHRQTANHLDELQTEFGRLQSDHIAALEEAQQRWELADAAQRRVETLSNPLSPENLWRWLVERGPRVVGVVVVMFGLLWFSRVLGRRMIQFMMVRGLAGSEQEQANRANTLAGVLHNAVNVGTFVVGVVTVLNEVGVPVGPVMGGAAVLGLAVAFGAQSLIKDYFSGFMLLLEQQYFINDVVQIGEVSGQVEQISLRMTMLRDQEGQAHFIPHGAISTVTNLTYNWSRAVFDVPVAYKENVDRVIDELLRLAVELRRHPEFGKLILEEPAMLGVDSLGQHAVVVKFWIKTRPLQQWTVKRELLRRIKNRFDEIGVEIPFPQQIVQLRDRAEKKAA